MPAGSRSEALGRGLRTALADVRPTWRALNAEQKAAAVGAVLLIVSTFGPFSFVEAAIVLIGVAVLALLRARAHGKEFHLPFGDGSVIAAAGAWAALLIVIRLFDRPLGQNLLALCCAALLMLAGLREKAKRPDDDIATEPLPDRKSERTPPKGSDPLSDRDSRGLTPAPRPPSEGPRSAAGARRASGEQLSLPDPLAPPKPLEPPEPPADLKAGRPAQPRGGEAEPDSAVEPDADADAPGGGADSRGG